jgi:hypothetical protein
MNRNHRGTSRTRITALFSGAALAVAGAATLSAAPAVVMGTEQAEARVLGAFDSEPGPGWVESTDAMMGGTSVAALAVTDGALAVSGELASGFVYPWSGAAIGLSQEGEDLSGFSELSFRIRGDGRAYRVMLINPGAGGAPPPMVTVDTTEAWRDVVIPLADFLGADLTQVQALTFVAVETLGAYAFQIDDVELR